MDHEHPLGDPARRRREGEGGRRGRGGRPHDLGHGAEVRARGHRHGAPGPDPVEGWRTGGGRPPADQAAGRRDSHDSRQEAERVGARTWSAAIASHDAPVGIRLAIVPRGPSSRARADRHHGLLADRPRPRDGSPLESRAAIQDERAAAASPGWKATRPPGIVTGAASATRRTTARSSPSRVRSRQWQLDVLYDPQTSGPLLAAVDRRTPERSWTRSAPLASPSGSSARRSPEPKAASRSSRDRSPPRLR